MASAAVGYLALCMDLPALSCFPYFSQPSVSSKLIGESGRKQIATNEQENTKPKCVCYIIFYYMRNYNII